MFITDITQAIGRTPLLETQRIEKNLDLKARILVKLEFLNPAGSTKDRAALGMVNDAEKRGLLKPGATIIEPTSGNTGIGLALISAVRGYKLILTMPDTMSVERINILKAYGAEIVLTPGAQGMAGSVAKAQEIHDATPGSIIAGQFENDANAQAHRDTTGPEIWEDCGGTIDILVSAVGTGGTITGNGEFLKAKKPDLKVVAVEPASSPLLSTGKTGPHKIQGIGANFVPALLNRSIYDEVICIENDEAFETAKMLGKTEGVLCGISSGAALQAAIKLAQRPENAGKTIVAILPDSGDRYYSTPLFQN